MRSPVIQTLQICWVAMFVIWAVTRLGTRRTAVSQADSRARAAVLVVWIAWFLLFNDRVHKGVLGLRFVPEGSAAEYIGAALGILGLLFAIWARFTIGRNWSAMATVTQDHELIRRGPYGIVRHPIYSGLMLATLGTAIAYGEVAGLLSVVLIVIAWGYKARLEESLMREQFGAQYDEYQHHVKGLIPFVW